MNQDDQNIEKKGTLSDEEKKMQLIEKLKSASIDEVINFDEEEYKKNKFRDIEPEGSNLEKLLNTDEQEELRRNFRLNPLESETIDPDEEILKKNFKDFLIARNISGSQQRNVYNTLFPSEIINDSGQIIEIRDESGYEFNDDEEHNTSVHIYRTDNGDILSLEVVCKCGNRTLVTFDYEKVDSDTAPEKPNIDMKDEEAPAEDSSEDSFTSEADYDELAELDFSYSSDDELPETDNTQEFEIPDTEDDVSSSDLSADDITHTDPTDDDDMPLLDELPEDNDSETPNIL